MLPVQFKDFYTLTIGDLGYYNPSDPFVGVVYCPGLVCMKTNQSINIGVIVKVLQGFVLWSASEYYEMTGNAWDEALDDQCAFLNRSEYLLDQALPEEHREYFRSLNVYDHLIPENSLVNELLKIYWDGGLLTRTQRRMVDKQLFLGSNSGELICNFEALRQLDVLASLGPQPGLDQAWVQAMIKLCKTEGVAYKDDFQRHLYATLNQFNRLIKPLSEALVSQWPPDDCMLRLE